MGRPEPCVLFAQSFVHCQLDEYVDEVLFAEPVVITACEFLEQNASPSTPNISLIGATSPPSFALEVFVHCEGESRFRRLCQPFLYSHSSSNVLEVEAIVTNHLVLRGSYRSLTLVVYGNTAEDLGQFNIGFDLDSSLANVVCFPSEGKLEDLPLALHLTKLKFEESMSSLKSIGFPVPEFDIPPEVKQLLLLTLKICQISDHDNMVSKVANAVVSAVSSYLACNNNNVRISWVQEGPCVFTDNKRDSQQSTHALGQTRKELLELYQDQTVMGDIQIMEDEVLLGSQAELLTAEMLVDLFNQSFPFFRKTSNIEPSLHYQNENMIIPLGIIFLLCTSKKGCFHFVNNGGMERMVDVFCHEMQTSTAITLMLLAIIECATRHGIGCEGFLGWWPRADANVPSGNSDGYCYLLKLLLGKPQHDVASLATYVLHRLRLYEIASRYESAVLSVLCNISADHRIPTDGIDTLVAASSQLKHILKLINLSGPIEDPSPVAFAKRLSTSGQSEGLLSYKATIDYIDSSKYSFSRWDVDTYLLSLLKERGFFPLSAALLSSPTLRSSNGSIADTVMEIASSIESILLSLLFCRSGFSFLLAQTEATELIILSLQDVEDSSNKTECLTLRQAAVFLSKGFFCHPQVVGLIMELHLKMGTAIDHLLATTPHSDELLWVLWEICAISRTDSGRQALLALGNFPEAISVLLDALRSYKDLEPNVVSSGTSPLSLAIFHSAAEIFEVIVTDSTVSSLRSWIGHAVELHKALHSSSPGSSRKDAPTRLLEWIDAGVIYHRNGAIGLLRYAAVLASGGDAHLSSTSVLVSDSIDVENVVGDSTSSSDAQIMDNLLGKLVSDKYFEGLTLSNTSVVQLTTAFRILAFISEDSAVAASLFEEGAVTLIYVVLVSCKSMLERLSNSYDYLVDEGAECNSTTDLLLERNHEQSLMDLVIPSLFLLINLLKKLQEAKEQYRNKKLLNALLRLHREVSPRLAACAANLCFPNPSSGLGFGAVCHLIASALAFWPAFGWTPSLFHCIVENVQAASSLALGPKDACSMLCLLGDLFPDEGIWLWKNEMPPLSALRTLSIGTILGPQAEREINWYMQSEHLTVLLVRLTPQLDRMAQIVLHFSFTSLVVIQDMLRVFIIRVACQRTECAVVLLRPMMSWMDRHVDELSLSDMDIFKVHRLLHFVASLLEHPRAKALLFKVGAVRILGKVLHRCSCTFASEGKLIMEGRVSSKSVTPLSWSLPVLKSLALIYNPQSMSLTQLPDLCVDEDISVEESSLIGRQLLELCQVLPVGRELLACVVALKELTSSSQGRNAVLSIYSQIQSTCVKQERDGKDSDRNIPNEYDWMHSLFLICWKKLLRSLESKDCALDVIVEIVYALCLTALCISMEGDNVDGVLMLKCLFGVPYDVDGAVDSSDEKTNDVLDVVRTLEKRMSEDEDVATSVGKTTLSQVKESMKALLFLLQNPASSSAKLESSVISDSFLSPSDVVRSVVMTSQLMPSLAMISVDDDAALSFSKVWKLNGEAEKPIDDFSLGGFMEKFVWECPDSSDKQLMPALSAKRKAASAESSGRRMRDNAGPEVIGSNAFSRGLSTPTAPSGPTRRDTFRQRKPNTSRPPSMHVDDYVARERNIDGASSSSNVVSSQRGGSTSGRPPSIHVDEFMARQRERQNPISVTVGDASQVKSTALINGNDPVKLDKPQQLKTDLDDDLQGIDIVFDAESESDDKLPFPQPDDNLQPPPVIIGESSPGSIVEETEVDRNGSPPASEDGGSRSDIPLRQPSSRSEVLMNQEVNISVETNFTGAGGDKTSFREHSEDSKHASPSTRPWSFDTQSSPNLSGFPSHFRNVGSLPSSIQPPPPPTFFQRNSPQQAADGSYVEQKLPNNQPPLPPMPPPSLSIVPAQAAEPLQSHSSPFMTSGRDVQPPLPSGYPPQAFDVTGLSTATGLHLQPENILSTGSSSSSNAQPILESKFLWNAVSSRPMPPLPPVPPSFSAPITHSPTTNSRSQASLYNQTTIVGAHSPTPSPISDASLGILSAPGTSLTSYSLPPFTPSLLVSRPASVGGTLFGSPTLQHGQNPSYLSQSPNSQSPVQTMHPRPPPPPHPQLPRPPQPPQHPGPHTQVSQSQSEQGMSFQQSSIQVQVNPLQIPQQLHIPPIQFYYQTQQQEPVLQPLQPMLEQVQPQNQNIQADSTTQQLKESGTTLQQYFSSPEAIQSLLSDRDKLCQLLEQHPKLMQMLQERLGQQ